MNLEAAAGRVAAAAFTPFLPVHGGCVPPSAGHHGRQHRSPACEPLARFGLSHSEGLNNILLSFYIQFSLQVQILTAASSPLRNLQDRALCWQRRTKYVSFLYCRQESPQIFERAGRIPRTELSVRVQHTSASDLKLFFWLRVVSGVNPFERRLLS